MKSPHYFPGTLVYPALYYEHLHRAKYKMEEPQIFDCTLKENISKCVDIVRGGGVIAFPTDTVYGIGCDPYNDKASERVFVIKGRDLNNPLPVLTATTEDVRNLAHMDSRADLLAERYWPGRLTLVLPLLDSRISSVVVAGANGSIAVRIPGNKCASELLSRCRYLVGTSANKSSEAAATNMDQILSSSLIGIDAILDGGCLVDGGMESTIVDLSKQGPSHIIREGAIKSTEIYDTLSREGLSY
jgi:L-threonylcarbamoyladenylate synthase